MGELLGDDAERELQDIAAGRAARSQQTTEGAREIASTVVAFHKTLLEGGLFDDLADDLTAWFFDDMLAAGRCSCDEPLDFDAESEDEN